MKNGKIFKRIVTVLLAGAMSVTAFTGCSGGGGGSSGTPADSGSSQASAQTPSGGGGGGTIRIAWWGNQLRNDTTVAMLDAYVAENPTVKYEAEFTDWSGYWDKLATQAASNNLPDIIQQDYAYIGQYHSKGQLANLSEFTQSGKLDVSNISDSILSLGSFDEKLYALCAGVNAVGMIYNTRLAKEAGVEVPMRFTYEEFMDIAAKVYEKTGIPSTVAGGYGTMQMMARDVGEVLYDVENKKIGASKATVLCYFNNIKAGIDQKWHFSRDVLQEASTAGVEDKPLSKGTGFNEYPGGSNMMAAHQAPLKDELTMVMFPKRSDATKESMYLRPSMFWSISEVSANKEIAADIINYYTNSEKAQDLLLAERGVPVSTVMADYLKPQLDPVQQKIFDYIAEVTKIAVPFDPPLPAGANEVNKLVDDLTDLVRYGELTPEAAADRFLSEANPILTKAAAGS